MCIRDRGGAEIEKIKAEVQKLTDKKLVVDIKEVKRPDRDAQLVACLLYTSGTAVVVAVHFAPSCFLFRSIPYYLGIWADEKIISPAFELFTF